MSNPTPSPEEDFKVPLLMLAMIIAPALIALSRVQYAVELMPPPDRYASPFGYTWSLLLFIVPIVVLSFWFLRHPEYQLEKKSFWITILLLTPLGFALDTFLGQSFFKFENRGAVLGLYLPGYDFHSGWGLNIPAEEFAFYFFGFIAILLLYIWCDLFWMKEYCLDGNDRSDQAQNTNRLISTHFTSLWIGLGLIAAALIYKYVISPSPGFPGYFTFLVVTGLIPAFIFFPVAKPLVNWRAFSVTLFMVLLISLLWEATLAVPYQWWGYESDQMIGIVVKAWASLPLEATIVWLVVTWITVIVYEVIRTFFHMERSPQAALFGSSQRD